MKQLVVALLSLAAFSSADGRYAKGEASATCQGTTTISCPAHIVGTLNSSDCPLPNGGWMDQYAVEIFESKPITISVTAAANLPLLVRIVDPIDGESLHSESDLGSVSFTYQPIDTLLATIVVATTSGTGGPYTFDLTCASTPPPPPSSCVYSGTLNCGATTSGQLTASDCPSSTNRYYDYYKFSLVKGQTIALHADSALPLWFEVYDDSDPVTIPIGQYVSSSKSPRITFTAINTGPHVIEIGTRSAGVTGSYTISVDCLGVTPPCRQRSVSH